MMPCCPSPASAELVLGIYPFPDTDPFVVHYRPSVYFLGNQPDFETALIGGEFTT